ncbi:hypothetical protein [Sphingomonas sp. ERG5]|uniref:hypothetical protein n=1 Tax=Sphingomonas sp. ERG5 TaxID=1381597 RepID=UPI00054C74E1|nr:hypothetical protein [Sphingomonas sp. ERG5]
MNGMLSMARWFTCTFAAALMISTAAFAQIDIARAEQNYAAVANGSKQLSDLTSLELQEIAAVARARRERQSEPKQSAYEKCLKRVRGENKTPTQLEQVAAEMKCSQR